MADQIPSPQPAHDLKAQALALCHALEEQPGSQYQTAAVLAAFKVYRAFESIEKHGEIRQWVFDVAAPSAMPAPSAAYLTKNGRLHVTAWECHGCGHRGIDDGDDANEACSDCDWRGPCPDEDVCPGCGREGTMVSACPKCGDRYYIKAEADLVIPTAIPAPEGAHRTTPAGFTPEDWTRRVLRHSLEAIEAGANASIVMNVEGLKDNIRALLAAPAPQAPITVRLRPSTSASDWQEMRTLSAAPQTKEPTNDR